MTHRILRWTLFVMTTVFCLAGPALALDIPHNTQQCSQCHVQHGAQSAFLTVNPAGINALCQSCHYFGGPATPADTHASSVAAGEDYTFSMTCNTCHDPHTQLQPYKKFIKTSIITPNSGTKGVIFNAATGAKSFADGDTTYDGICEVCHTLTTKHRNNNVPANDHTHNAGTNCTSCHKHDDLGVNNFGFKPSGGSCTDCHGSIQNQRRVVTLDFTAAGSHHISATGRNMVTFPLSKFDCVMCHLEGDAAGATTAFHNDASFTVNLRDVDDATNTAWTYQDPDAIVLSPNANAEISNVTKFCIRCHDADGIGDAAFISAVDAADTSLTRTARNPFVDGANLGSATSPDVNTQFSPANFSSHSIKNRWNIPAGCGGACPAGQHPNHSTGVCTADETCPGTCSAYQTCSVQSGNRTCLCTLGTVAACNACAANYSGAGCTTFTDPCGALVVGAACANSHGACINGVATPLFEQIVRSETGGTGWANTWTSGNANQGSALHNNGGATTLSLPFASQAPSTTYYVWVAASRIKLSNGGGATISITTKIDGTTTSITPSVTADDSFAWISAGTATFAAGAHTATFTCTAHAVKGCAVDGLFITTDSAAVPGVTGMTPYATANWDLAALDIYTPAVPAGKSCQCGTGYTGAGCLACASGYHLEGSACVADAAGACNGQTCNGNGTCYLATGSIATCGCDERYYGASPLACNLCASGGPAWQSGQKAPSFPGIRAAAFSNSWNENATTECFDCHMPGNLGATKPYSNNAHGTVNNKYMLDSISGTDIAPVGTSNGASTNVVCIKCHALNSYVTGSLNTRYGNHNQTGNHLDETRNYLGQTMGTQIGCFNCHGGGALGSIHGENTVMTDDGSLGSYNGVLFLNGAGIDYWAGGPSITCSSRKSTNAWDLGCTQHTSQGYTRQY